MNRAKILGLVLALIGLGGGIVFVCENGDKSSSSYSKHPVGAPPGPAIGSPKKSVNALMTEITDVNAGSVDPDERIRIIKEVCNSKSVDFIPFLIQQLMTVSPWEATNGFDIQKWYPCSTGLVDIGEPSVLPVVKRFDECESSRERMVLLDVLGRIKGKYWTSEFLNGRIERTTEAVRHESLIRQHAWLNSSGSYK